MAPGISSRIKALAPLPENLFHEPLEYLSADTFRQECMRKLLDALSTEVNGGVQPARNTLETLKEYLERDLPLHREDTEEDLIPRLRGLPPTCLGEEGQNKPLLPLNEVFALFVDANKRAEKYRGQIVDDLQHSLEHGSLPDSRRFWQRLGNFCEIIRWVAETEKRVMLPYARDNLDKPDLVAMGQSMAVRRKAGDLFETPK